MTTERAVKHWNSCWCCNDRLENGCYYCQDPILDPELKLIGRWEERQEQKNRKPFVHKPKKSYQKIGSYKGSKNSFAEDKKNKKLGEFL